jgi:hypothetical protein
MSPQAAGCTMQTGRRSTGCVLSCCQQGTPRRALAVASRDRRIEKAVHESIRQVDRVWPSRRVRSRDNCCRVPHQWEQAAGDTHDGSHNRVKRGAADPVRSAPIPRCPDAPMSRIDEHLACTSVWPSPRQFPSSRPAEQPHEHSSSVFGRWPKCWRSADPPSTTSSMPTSSLRFESARVSGFLSSSSQHHVLGRPRA